MLPYLLLNMTLIPGRMHLGDEEDQLELVKEARRNFSSISLSSDYSSEGMLTIQNKLKRVRLSSELETLDNRPIKRNRMARSLQKAHLKEPPFPFLNLPPELRNSVYKFYLEDHFTLKQGNRILQKGFLGAALTTQVFDTVPAPPILLASRKLHQETIDVLLNEAVVRIDWLGNQTACKVYKSNGYIRANIRKLRVEIYPPTSRHFMKMVKVWLHTHSYFFKELTPLALGELQSLEIVYMESGEAKWSTTPDSPRRSFKSAVYDALGRCFSDVESLLGIFTPLKDIPRVKIRLPLSLEKNENLCRLQADTELTMKLPGLGSHFRQNLEKRWVEELGTLLRMSAESWIDGQGWVYNPDQTEESESDD